MIGPDASDPLYSGALEVARKLNAAGYQAFLAGGCVRDMLLAKSPKDYDIASDATPVQVTALFKRTVEVGAAFGVVRVLIGQGREYEVATFRTEAEYSDGRRPDVVHYSKSAEEDVTRRDFTINALLMVPETRQVIDHVGGQADLAARVIRAVGDPEERFREDRLRMLRAIRFAARLDFQIEPATFAAIQKHASEIGVVSVERIVQELTALFASERPGQGWRALESCGLLAALAPHFGGVDAGAASTRLDKLPREAGTLAAAERTSLGLALVLTGVADLKQRLQKLKLSRETMQDVLDLAAHAEDLRAPDALPVPDRVRLVLDPRRALRRAYQRTSLESAHPAIRVLDAVESDLQARPLPALPLVTGEDLKALGIPPGPSYKKILTQIEDQILSRGITTREQALTLAGTLADPDRSR